ncbi:hypothetical protein KPL71_020458 [Citrus sinensis]|uniref:Uncharacterized protein n=1 Tax=Citrus sinensis TaxID=2711 RepID=A0ACB8J7Y6_CITSI|nr:hypothetical protein KPL71_020458 [Citrus sinensis]
MAAPESEQVIFIEEGDDEYSTDSGGSDLGYDSDLDPSYSPLEDTHATFSKLSIGKKSKSRIGKDLDVGVDEIEEKVIQKIIEAGQQEKLKVEQCKVYLRKNGLRLTGNKPTLIQRIKEHLEISNGGGERRYPIFSFVLDCKACSASGPPCGKRIVAGRIVKESYGAAKQQHTFTIEVLWSKGEKPLPPLHPLLIKGRNLYHLKTLRQDVHESGSKMLPVSKEFNCYRKSEDSFSTTKILFQKQPPLQRDSNKTKSGPQQLSIQPQHSADSKKAAEIQLQLSELPEQKLAVIQNNCQTQVPQNPVVKLSGIREAPINRQRLKSINQHHPTSPPQEQSYMNQELCPYYRKGRCYFDDNC